MNKNRVKGKTKEIEGRVLRGVGKVTGSRKTQVKGALRQVEGKMQSALGRAEDVVDGTTRRARAKTTETYVVEPRPRLVRVQTTRTTTVLKKRTPGR